MKTLARVATPILFTFSISPWYAAYADEGTPPAGPRPAAVALAQGLTFHDDVTVDAPKSFLDAIPATNADGMVNAIIEIPAGSNAKWEVKPDGVLRWDMKDDKPRVVKYLPYVGNYGCIPRTRQVDGDPLDILVLAPAYPRGTVVPVRLIGVAKFTDKGLDDAKLLAVAPGTPLGEITSLEDLDEKFPGVSEIVRIWFSHYKGPDGGGMVYQSMGTKEEAAQMVEATAARYEAEHIAAK